MRLFVPQSYHKMHVGYRTFVVDHVEIKMDNHKINIPIEYKYDITLISNKFLSQDEQHQATTSICSIFPSCDNNLNFL